MTQKVDFHEIERTLFGANGEAMLDEAFQYKANMVVEFGRMLRVNENIV
jgi:hypothetical protein